MRVNSDNPEITQLCRRYRELSGELLAAVELTGESVTVPLGTAGDFPGFDRTRVYMVREGTVTLSWGARTICALEAGDLLLAERSNAEASRTTTYGSETGAELVSYARDTLQSLAFADPAAAQLWSELLLAFNGIMIRVAAEQLPSEAATAARLEVYEAGDIIINQGDRADNVFNMNVGSAQVLVDGVVVGQISGGEIFGAMAALTQSDRSATVQANSRCEVVKIPREQFKELIETNPATIHRLLVDMANSIVSLNEQLVGLRGKSAA